MDPRQAELLRAVAPVELGGRIKALRIARGLTQGQLAGPGASVGYISRMESGQRRPTAKVLVGLAERLDAPLEQLLGGVAPREIDEVRLLLDYAELSLESGQAAEAEQRASEALVRLAATIGVADLTERARYLHARSLEALGRVDDAIIAFEDLLDGRATGLTRASAALALARTYRNTGDMARSIEVGERILAELAAGGLDGCDEAVQLAVTVASAYFEQGDEGHAVRLCRRAIIQAEEVGSPVARASAYWNASIMQADRGQVQEALPLAERSLAILADGSDARNVAILRSELGRMQLHVNPPEVEAACGNLRQAKADLAWSSGSRREVASIDLNLARACLLTGDVTGARELLAAIGDAVAEAPLTAAEAAVLDGELCAAEGDIESATAAYARAVHLLTGAGSDREAAQLWLDLADLFEGAQMPDAALDAYKRAAASSGLRSRTRPSVAVQAQLT